MYRPSSGRSSLPSSCWTQKSSASAACSTRGRSPRRSRSPSPSPRGLRGRRSPSPSRWSRARPPSGGSSCGSEQREGSLSQRLSLGRCSQFASRCSPTQRSDSSEEQSLQPAVGDDRYGIDPIERRRLSDRLSFGDTTLSDVERSGFADSPVFHRHLSCPQSHEQYSSPGGSLPNSFSRGYKKDYHSRDVYQLGFNMNYDHLQYISREPHRDGELFRKHLYSTEETRREPKYPQYNRDDRLLDVNRNDQDLLSSKQNYRKRTLSSSPSPGYPDEDFRELDNSRSEKITCQDMPSSGHVIPHLTNSVQSSEPQFLHTPEKAPAMPRKSILKNRLDVPSVQNFGSSLRKKEYQELTPETAGLRDDFLLPHERASQDGSSVSHILDRMVDSTSTQEKRRHSFLDVENAEKFLYGDDDINCPTEKLTVNGGNGGKESVSLNKRPSSSILSVKPDTSDRSGTEYEKIHDLHKTVGLDPGVAEIGKGAACTQKQLHGRNTLPSLDDPSHKADSSEEDSIQSNASPSESNQKKSLSPCGPSQPSSDISSVSVLEYAKSKTLKYDNFAGPSEQSLPSVSVTPPVPPSLPNMLPPPPPVPQYPLSDISVLAAQAQQNYPPSTMAPPIYNGHCMAYSAMTWPMYPPPQQSDPALPDAHGLASVRVPPHPTRPNLRVIETVSTVKNPEIKGNKSVLMEVPITPDCGLLPESPGTGTTERISDGKSLASEKPQVLEGGEKLMPEEEAKRKKLSYLMVELKRRCKQQKQMLLHKKKERGKKKDPLLVELNRVQGAILKDIAQIQIDSRAVKMIQFHFDSLSDIIRINTLEMPVK